MKDPNVYPEGWDAQMVKDLITRYDNYTDDDWLAEDEAAYAQLNGQTTITVPTELLPAIRQLIAEAEAAKVCLPS